MRNCRLEKFYGKLANRTRVVGSSISTSDPMIAEALGYSGLDFLWIDMEHTPLEKAQILYQLMAVQSTGIPAFVRVPWNDFILVKPILDMGPDGIIFPMISSADEARKAIAAIEYPPKGIRGYGPLRANKYGNENEYLQNSRNNLLCFVQIETLEGVEQIEEICTCAGIDGILYGGMDLSASLGHIGKVNTKEFENAIGYVAKIVKKYGLILGGCGPDYGPLMELYFKVGLDLYLASGDLAMLMKYAEDMVKRFKSI